MMPDSKYRFISCLLILLVLVFGCTNQNDNSNSNEFKPEDNKTEESVPDDSNSGESVADNNESEEIESFISKDEFIHSVKELNPEVSDDKRLTEALDKDGFNLEQLLINTDNNRTKQIIVWANSLGYSGAFVVYEQEGDVFKPIYSEIVKDKIYSVKLVSRDFLGENLLEIVRYQGTGSFSGQWVDLYRLKAGEMEEIWSHSIVSTEFHMDESGDDEYINSSSSYSLIPGFQRIEEVPTIALSESTNIYKKVDGEEELVDSRNSEKTFIWDEDKEAFTEESKP